MSSSNNSLKLMCEEKIQRLPLCRPGFANMITPFPGNTPRRASSVAVGSVFIRCTLKVKLATLCLETRLGAIGEFSRK